MRNKDIIATSNAKENIKSDAMHQRTMVEMVDRTGESAHQMQMPAHSKNTSAKPTVDLTNIPSDLKGEIARFLSDKELMRLIISSKKFFNDSNLVKTMIRKINESYAIKQLIAGSAHTLALTHEGRVLAWGWNRDGQLGLGHNQLQNNTPKPIPNLNNVVQIVAGGMHTLALTQEGHVWVWGGNGSGQLGTRHNTWLGQLGLWINFNQHTPQRIIGLNKVVQIVAGGNHTLALTHEGYGWAWGWNRYGQLGLRHNNDQNTPERIEGLSNVAQLVAGSKHTLALTQERQVWAWGLNNCGQLGFGHNYDQNTPGRVEGLNDVTQLVAGGGHTFALTHEGPVWAWGCNRDGQLGLGHNINQNTPRRIPDLNNMAQLVAGDAHTLARTHEGHLWAWGWNKYGQLGLEPNESQNTPQRITGLNNVMKLVAGQWHTLALTQEGHVCAWGHNWSGEVGLGHNNNQNTPSRINMMPSSIQALLQHLEHHYRKISARNGGKSVYLGNDNGDAKERSSSCSTAASSAALFSSKNQSSASVTQELRSTEDNSLNCTIL